MQPLLGITQHSKQAGKAVGQWDCYGHPILHWLIIVIINVVVAVAIIINTFNNGNKYSSCFRLVSISISLFSEARSLLKLLPAAKDYSEPLLPSCSQQTLSRYSSSPDTSWKCQICLLWRAPVFNNILIFQANTWQAFRFCQWVLASLEKKEIYGQCW